MDVTIWLEQLGLVEYARAFLSNDVDDAILRHLTDEDLQSLGVGSAEHRRRILDAAAGLRVDSAEAERRQLTVMYCQITGVGLQGNQETVRQVVRRFHQICVQRVSQDGGHVANFFGDCILVYFGWPRAHEDDPERAVRSGLALVDRIQASDTSLEARVGIATGRVVVGDFLHEGPAQAQSAMGFTPNLAARVLSLARSGQVLIEEQSHRLVEPVFVTQALGSPPLKGVTQAVAVYQVIGERSTDSRFDARPAWSLGPMVGRDPELALLRGRWGHAREGSGAAVVITGEAGIGKSRLVRALRDECATQAHAQVIWQCSPHHVGSALWPVIQRIQRLIDARPGEASETTLAKLEASIGAAGQARHLYATLLGIDAASTPGPLLTTPQMLRDRTLELIVEQLLEEAAHRPLLLVVEDAHWIDPTTQELIESLLQRLERVSVLLLITARADSDMALAAHPQVTRMSLDRLGRANVETMVTRLADGALRGETIASIAAQAEGVPLFVEELTRAVLESGTTTLPASLHGRLTARLDRAPEVKEVAQVAACIGREFDADLLRAVADDPAAVDDALGRLTAAALIFRRGRRFSFKHALVQEAAYDGLLHKRRQAIHARILAVLEAGAGRTPFEILAHHAERAMHVATAAEYWKKAATASMIQCAYVEAASHFERAIAQVRRLPEDAGRRGMELELHLRLGQARIASQGMGSSSAGEAFAHATRLAQAGGCAPLLAFEVQHWSWSHSFMRGRYLQADELARQGVVSAQAVGTVRALQLAHRMVAETSMLRGRFGEAEIDSERAMTLMKSDGGSLFGVPAELTLCHRAWLLYFRGHFEQSRGLLDPLRDAITRAAQAVIKAHLELSCCLLHCFFGDFAAVHRHADAMATLADKHRLSMHRAYAATLASWADLESGRPVDEVLPPLQEGLAGLAAAGSGLAVPYLTVPLTTALARCGRHSEALATVDAALAECTRSEQLWCYAELWRLRGELTLQGPDRDEEEAVRCFERGLSDARERGARSWELRIARSLSRHLMSRGRSGTALEPGRGT